MNYKIWDKKEKINNVDAENIIESLIKNESLQNVFKSLAL